ncbi:hypothetical protein RCL1_002124 [Eukaryota sp. TZLM3-RCL]
MSATESSSSPHAITLKVALLEQEVGKTSLMVRYVESRWDEAYSSTLGINFMEKTVALKNAQCTFIIFDLGGAKSFSSMLPLVLTDAVAVFFMFDLTRKETLKGVKNWFKQARIFNKSAIPFLVGTKFDTFVQLSQEDQLDIQETAKKYARAMGAPLVFCSSYASINVQKLFKLVLAKAFNLECTIPQMHDLGQPILEY